jgi:MYXO-CTERM domain-containing protein
MDDMRTCRWFLGALVVIATAAGAERASADVGPIDPARKICMGSPAGTECTYEGKKGTCQGPHPSRMYCVTNAGSASNAGSAETSAGSAASAQGGETKPQEAPTPAKQRGCMVADPGSTTLIGLAVVALAARRRRSRSASVRQSRSMRS